ncbi:MAG: hypothetical protein KA740_15135 [Rhodoferax sp.]|jgi:hypothetical protein|nr:hypothetical protein [Rhodoferax sp.]
MNAMSPIQVIKTTKRAARCGKSGESSRSSTSEVRQLQAELAYVRSELHALRNATQQLVRYVL